MFINKKTTIWICLCCLIFLGGFVSGVFVEGWTRTLIKDGRNYCFGGVYLLAVRQQNNSVSSYDGQLVRIGLTTNFADLAGLTSWDEILVLKRFSKDAPKLEDLFEIPFSTFGKKCPLLPSKPKGAGS